MELQVTKIKGELPRGYLKTLSEMTGYGLTSVWLTMNGRRFNIKIIEAALKLRAEYMERQNLLKNQVS